MTFTWAGKCRILGDIDTCSRKCRDEYDVRELTPDPFPYSFYTSYLNTPEVQAAIGAYQNFTQSSNAVYNAFTATGDDK